MKHLVFLFLIMFLALGFSCSDSDRKVGGTCSSDGDCADRCLTSFPGGMCTLSCRSDDDCTSDTVCADTEGGVCLIPCDGDGDADCADLLGPGYKCDDESTFDDRDIRVCEDSG